MSALKIVNLDRFPYTLPGGIGHADDRAVVLDYSQTERHPVTGESQPLTVYRGTLSGATAFVKIVDDAAAQIDRTALDAEIARIRRRRVRK